MKKAFSIVLALVLMMGLCVSAFAAELAETDDTVSIEVKARAESSGDAGTIYSLDVDWGAMLFIYAVNEFETWVPETHTNQTIPAGSWSAQGNSLTVTNHSNAEVDVNIAADQSAHWTGADYNITVTVSSDAEGAVAYTTTRLDNAETTAYGNPAAADSVTAYVKLAGNYEAGETFVPVGNIIVSFLSV